MTRKIEEFLFWCPKGAVRRNSKPAGQVASDEIGGMNASLELHFNV
jgi:hypothetical protein